MVETYRDLPHVIRKYGIHTFQISPLLQQNETLMIAIKSKIDQEILRTHFAASTKVGPIDSIRMLVNAQVPGYLVSPLSCTKYSFIPEEMSCYCIQNNGDLPELNKQDSIAIHISGDLDILSVSMFALHDE